MSGIEINSPLVSIIVPNYNGERFLAETLESVFVQTYQNWECIIIDDGSTDNSKQVAALFIEKDKRFKYFYQLNKGTSAARNKGIAESTGKYTLPLDADDKISAQYLEQAAAVLQKNNDIKLVYCKAAKFGKVNEPWNLRPYSLKEMLIENMIFCTALFRKEDFEKTAGYSEDMKGGFEDWDFWLTFLNKSDKVYQIPEVHFFYRIQDISRNPSFNEKLQKELRQKMYEKHKNLYEAYFQIPDILFEYNLMRNKYDTLQKSYTEALQSATFKIGRIFIKPYHFVKNIFR